MKKKISDMRNDISLLRDIASQMVSIREMMDNLEEDEVNFFNEKLKDIIDKYKNKL